MDAWGKCLVIAAHALLWLPSAIGLVIVFRLMWLKPYPGDVTFLRLRKWITLAEIGLGLITIILIELLNRQHGGMVTAMAVYFLIAYLVVPKCSQLVKDS